MAQQQVGRYQHKVRLGLVPFRYDKDTRSFNEGAWKNWRRIGLHTTEDIENSDVRKRDAQFLREARLAH